MSYIDNGTFCGYAWTTAYDGASIDPPCPEAGGDCFAGEICATAEIPANEDPVYPGVMIGWSVAQKSSGGTVGTFTGTFTSITPTFTVTPAAAGEVRIILKSGNSEYCAPASSGTPISASTFAQECWSASPKPMPAGTPIKELMLQVNGADAAQSVEFCLTNLTVQ